MSKRPMNKRMWAAIAASGLVLQPVMASAQQASCLSEDELSAMAIYAVPSMVRTLQQRCGPELSSSGFLARDGGALASRYTALQGRAWPRAKAGLLKVVAGKANSEAAQSLALVSSLPDEHVRPLVDALIVQELAPQVPLAECGRVERAVSALAPLEPELAGNLIAVAAGLFARDEAPICPPPPA